jgi:hydrogenase expression/formation protein HypC
MCLAIPGQIVTVDVEPNLGWRHGKVTFGGIRRDVCLDYTPEAQVGDYVLVHVGFALSIIDEEEAERVFEALRQLDLLDELQESAPQNS